MKRHREYLEWFSNISTEKQQKNIASGGYSSFIDSSIEHVGKEGYAVYQYKSGKLNFVQFADKNSVGQLIDRLGENVFIIRGQFVQWGDKNPFDLKVDVVVGDWTELTDAQRVEKLISKRTYKEIYNMFHKKSSSKNGFSHIQANQLLGYPRSGNRDTLAWRLYFHTHEMAGETDKSKLLVILAFFAKNAGNGSLNLGLIKRIFNSSNSNRNMYSISEVCIVFGLNGKGSKNTLAQRFLEYAQQHLELDTTKEI